MSNTLFSKPIESTFEKQSSEVTASKYKFERTLKRTLCGTIKLATNVQRQCPVAIKLSSRKTLSDLTRNNCAENPQEEIRLMTKLRDSPLDGHQFVIQLLDTYTLQKGSDLIDCTVLEFADGGEFFEHIQTLAQQGGRMDLNSVRNAFIMIAKGVKFIHKNGIVHLDLSLENILLTKQKILKVCDFGLAREGRIFKLSTIPGKFPYMAPEVFAKKEFDGQKADVWSLGVILWCLLTSLALYEIPADSDSRFHRLRNGKQGIKEILTAFQVHGIPEVVIDLLSGMLNVNPTQRLNIQEVLDHPWFHTSPTTESKSTSKSIPSTTDDCKIIKPTTKTVLTSIEESAPSSHFSYPQTPVEESVPTTSHFNYPHLGQDPKIICPPSDDSWSTYHRLYDQFEEKYGKLISAQNRLSDYTQPSYEQPSSKVERSSQSVLQTDTTFHYAPTSTRRSSNQVGWKRKKGFKEHGRRISPTPPSRLILNES
jgi:serine/threonine protein kinase